MEAGIHQSVQEVWFAGCHSDVGGQYRTFYRKPLPLTPATFYRRSSYR